MNEQGEISCRTKRGAALLPMGVFAMKLRSTYIDAVYEAVNDKKRPGSASFKNINKTNKPTEGGRSSVSGVPKKTGGAFALRMRTMEASLGAAGMKVDNSVVEKADESAWVKLVPILEDAADLIKGNDVPLSPTGDDNGNTIYDDDDRLYVYASLYY